MKNKFYLKDLDQELKYILIAFLTTLGLGVLSGMFYLYYTTNSTPTGVIEHYKGNQDAHYEDWDDFLDKPPKVEKYLHDMLETTHSHVISFAIISILLGLIFYFNSVIVGKFKLFIIIEPFISTLITFMSLWIMRYLSDSFVYLVMISAGLLYPCWFIMIFVSIYELLIKSKS
tara:strand:+ start:3254 stop:3772 length:519 start_codon:yes stop_codon:yes gene_type:complete